MNIRQIRNRMNIGKFFQKKPNWTLLFLIGFLGGTIATQVWGSRVGFLSDIYSEANLKRLKYLQIDGGELLFFVLKERLFSFLMIFCLSTTSFGILFLWLFVFGVGIAFGIVVASAVYKFGIAGSVLAAAGMMPHMLFYVPAFLATLNFGYQICIKLHFPKWEYASKQPTYSGEFKGKVIKFMTFILVVIIGILTESYVNPFIIKVFLKLFI